MNKKKVTITIIALSFLAFAWIGYITLNPDQENPGMIRFLSLAEIHTVNQTERVRLGGLVSPGTILVSQQNLLECKFDLAQGEHTVPVQFIGTRPDLFKDEAEVIVEGIFVDGLFKADQLQTKCASRYEGDLRDESSYKSEAI
ncbi:MAG: cytochrome c maturation protein CcmE [Candidatus Marinimicrobia bacterium]|jgi:cytochrome c-type biogenesis protein CcmE|nr:cytochrome c maturation protein CcmE [Candidatus Neomarinimicrobiota bacterium]MBT3945465.1 cytochrome c maturation protein CcmE [Candidatus Neomarinimicrobiota bacterium]MBT4555174.1 cytochrome c maturation protein CcmE [Candidatus Neomarinimicrobiota bacterium]MBT5748207.1 cytochrome c maturation protein CcmE [Candidatus Neomarinimicrobiota bacterium]MBT6796793.1 cytochrome c maturation protein CcmE [Candidatus Neomarinimicrobiota bacterium]|tara:strand:+ start:10817 stop:11245 length:429 start_codon:yes stop_codon:yes gene_type:complete